MPKDDDDFEIAPQEYFKGVPGSFDASFFTDPDTGKFRMPVYNESIKGLVRIVDMASARSYITISDLDEYELNFRDPIWVVERFYDFIDRFPAASFNKGISREKIFHLFRKFRYEMLDLKDEPLGKYYYMPPEKVREAIDLGLLTEIDPTKELAKHWSSCHPLR